MRERVANDDACGRQEPPTVRHRTSGAAGAATAHVGARAAASGLAEGSAAAAPRRWAWTGPMMAAGGDGDGGEVQGKVRAVGASPGSAAEIARDRFDRLFRY